MQKGQLFNKFGLDPELLRRALIKAAVTALTREASKFSCTPQNIFRRYE